MTSTCSPVPTGASAVAEISFARSGTVSLGLLIRNRVLQTKAVNRSGGDRHDDVAA
jgi:hypothetical protein